MKRLIFVSDYQLEYVNFDILKQKKIKFTLILNEYSLGKLKGNIRQYFDSIYTCRSVRQADGFLKLNQEDLVQAVEKDLSNPNFINDDVSIISFYEFEIEAIYELSQKFTLNSIQISDPLLYRDKGLMKKAVASIGLKVPKSTIIHSGKDISLEFRYLVAELELPFIVKPTDSAGSVGVKKIYSKADFEAVTQLIANSQKDYICEEFIDGTLFHCDFILNDGEIIFEGYGEYFYPCHLATQGKLLGSMILPECAPQYEHLRAFSLDCVSALGIKRGALHMEVFKKSSNGELYFLEVGLRPPGMKVCTCYKNLYGNSLQDLLVASLLNLSPQKQPIVASLSSVWGHIPVQSGIVKSNKRPQVESDLQLTYSYKTGDQVSQELSYLNALGTFEITCEKYSTIREDFEILRNFEFVELIGENY